MKKYNKFYASKYKYPTKVVSDGKNGTLIIGHKVALRDLEKKLGRSLSKETKVKTRGGNWCFYEPKA